MANENVTRVTADASGYTAELAKATRSAQAFAESNEAASARVAAAQAAVAEATSNGSTASTRAINSFISSLARQSDAYGKSTTEMLRQRAAALGVLDAAEPLIAHMESVARATADAAEATKAKSAADRAAAAEAAAASAASERAAADAQRFVDALSKEAATLGMSRTQLLQYEAAQKGLTAETADSIAKIEAHEKAMADAAAASKAQAAAERDAAAAAAQIAAQNERAAADTQRFVDAVNREAAALGKSRAELLAEEAARRGVTAETSGAIAKLQEHAAATEDASKKTHSFNLNTQASRRELLVLMHELSQGNFKQFGGSLMVLAEQTDATSLIFNKTALSIGAFVAVVALSVVTTIHAAEALAEYGENIERIARSTGLSTDSIQKFGFAAGVVGVSTKDAAAALSDLAKAQNEAIHGNNDAVAAFKSLGISQSDLKKSSPEQLLLKVADAFAASKDGAGKAAVANELFGSSGADLISLLDRGSQGLTELGKTAEDVGGVLGADTVAQLAAFKEQLNESTEKMSAMNISAKTELLPTILNISSALSDNASLKPVLIDFYDGVAATVKAAAVAIAAAVTAAEHFGTALNTTANIANRVGALDFSGATKAFEDGKKDWEADQKAYESFVSRVMSPTAPVTPHAAAPTRQINYATGQNSSKGGEDALNSQMRDLKDQLDAREKLIAASVDHIKSLQQQGVIDAKTAIQQEHDARAAGYADELQLADQEIALAQHKKQTQALTEWQNKKKAIQAAIAKNDQETTDAMALLEAKEVAATKAYSDALAGLLQTRADAAASQLQGKTLGATDADDLARATAAAKEYSEKYLDLTKSLTENKISTSQYDDEITALQAYEKKRLALESQTTEQIRALNADGYAGAQKAAADYAEDASNKFKQVGSAVTDVAQGMEDAFVSFVSTGKLSFSSLATSIIADIARMQAKAAISGLFNYAVGAIGSYFGGTSSSVSAGLGLSSGATSTIATSTSSLVGSNSYGFYGAYADGGHVTGPGSGTSDDIAAWLSNGEFVVNAKSTAENRGLLEAINSGSRVNGIARYATGGYVGSTPSAPAERGGDTNVQVDVSTGSGSLDQTDVTWLQGQIKSLVDSRLAQKMKGQGGYAWQQKYGSVG
ncbi:phage tail tape measure C-terminal domain-containing protein [Paraburkholderia tropica]|uniref:phage tail tape measure C-terminal domain-containing protein n=1 Tax=Paraburkholderia tropica TaxID=92647 RepID=UPI002AB6BD2C|nr:phage tail tape measure C-terminal domain-containing protein [Paraburkholderia tropica]